MKRPGLVLQLAVAICETLGWQHALSLPNAKRYVTREIMQKHRIRRDTKVENADWLHALHVSVEDRRHHFDREFKSVQIPLKERLRAIIQSESA